MQTSAGLDEAVSIRSRPLRVWIVDHYSSSSPDDLDSLRHAALSRRLVEHGVEVTIFAAGFDHSERREGWVHGPALATSIRSSGVRFVLLRTWPYKGNDWRRTLNTISFAVLATLSGLGRARPDVVVGVSVHPFAALSGWLLARRHGARFIYEIGDLWPQTLIHLGAMSPRSQVARALWAIEALLTRRSEALISALPLIADYLASRGLPTDHVRYVPNGLDLGAFDAAQEQAWEDRSPSLGHALEVVRRHRANGETIFAYTGAHGRVNRLEVVLDALASVNRRGTHRIALLLVGDGPEKAGLVGRATSLGIENVEFLEPVTKNQLAAFLAEVDVGVIHTTFTPVYQYGISFNKLYDYMAARLPIAFATTTAADPIVATGAGISVAPDDPEALADAFEALSAAGPEERRRMGERGRAFAEQEHDMRVLSSRFADIVEGAGLRGRDHARGRTTAP